MLNFFNKKISFDVQLSALKETGIVINEGVTPHDFEGFESIETFEKEPYKRIIENLGIEIEREPFTPKTNKLWLCDFERIEDDGDYKTVLERLEMMTGHLLGLTEIKDCVDGEKQQAWIEFKLNNNLIHWDLNFQDDWLDPEFLIKYDTLLQSSKTGLRIYINATDFGQSSLLGAFTVKEFGVFNKLSKIKMQLMQ